LLCDKLKKKTPEVVMNSIFKAEWIKIPEGADFEVGLYKKKLGFTEKIANARLNITARGVYEAFIDGARVGDFILAPGCTEYNTRLQVQTYDVTNMIKQNCLLQSASLQAGTTATFQGIRK
jgi:alpha-L-rhamnosidase